LYGLLHKDGCWGPLDGHHIHEVGSGGDDVIENIISLCRKHHGMAQEYKIELEELLAILTRLHGYQYGGVQSWTPERYIKRNLEAPKLWIHRNQPKNS
jgi:hypothetical protein